MLRRKLVLKSLLLLFVLFAAAALGWVHVAAKTGDNDKPPAVRPLVKAKLKDGTMIEGVLSRFADGVYTVQQGNSPSEFRESDVQEIRFVAPRIVAPSAFRDRIAVLSRRAGPDDLQLEFRKLGAKADKQFGELLADADPEIRLMTARAIWNVSCMSGGVIPRELESPLIKCLHDEDPRIRALIPNPLSVIGASEDGVVAPLVEALDKDEDHQVVEAVLQSFGRIAAHRKTDSLSLKTIVDAMARTATQHPNVPLRLRAMMWLGLFGERGIGAADALVRLSNDPNNEVREAASTALKKIGYTLTAELRKRGTDKRVIEALVTCSQMRAYVSPEMARKGSSARETLIAAGPENLDAVFLAVELDDQHVFYSELAPILAAWGERIVPELNKRACDKNPHVRQLVAASLRTMPLKALPDAIRTLVEDDDQSVREVSISVLTCICGTDFYGGRTAPKEVTNAAVPLMLEVLKRHKHREAFSLAYKLVTLSADYPEVLPPLLQALRQSTNGYQREQLVRDLGQRAQQLRNPEDIVLVVKAFTDLVENDTSNVVRVRAAACLGGFGARAKSALPVLRKAANDADRSVAKEARSAISRIESALEDDSGNHAAEK